MSAGGAAYRRALDIGIDRVVAGLAEPEWVVQFSPEGMDDAALLRAADEAIGFGAEKVSRKYLNAIVWGDGDAAVRAEAQKRLGSRLTLICEGLAARTSGDLGPPRALVALDSGFFDALLVDEAAALVLAERGLAATDPVRRGQLKINWPAQRESAFRLARMLVEAGALLLSDIRDQLQIGLMTPLEKAAEGRLNVEVAEYLERSRLFGEGWERYQTRKFGRASSLERLARDLNDLSGILQRCSWMGEQLRVEGVTGWELSLRALPMVLAAVRERAISYGLDVSVTAYRTGDAGPAYARVSITLRLDGYPTRLSLCSILPSSDPADEPQLRAEAAWITGASPTQITACDPEPRVLVRHFEDPGDLPEVSRERLIGRWRCRHPRAEWGAVGLTSAYLTCPDCGTERLMATERHRLPPSHPLAPDEGPEYIALRRGMACLAGEDPNGVLTTVEELRILDGLVPADPSAYAVGDPSREIGAGRQIDQIAPRRGATLPLSPESFLTVSLGSRTASRPPPSRATSSC